MSNPRRNLASIEDSAMELQSIAHSPSFDDMIRSRLEDHGVGDLRDGDTVPDQARRPSKESFMLYTPDEESALVRKLDRRLVLFMALLYMLSFLDRSNIGNARIAGLTEDLRLSSSQFEWLLTAFYITYILFEWMTLLYRVFPAHIYVCICVVSWGSIASLQSVAGSFASMFVLRALLGVAEAAFGPGIPFYLSFFFKRDELALRTGLFISAAPLATSFASSLAWLITRLGQSSPIAAWRLLFLIEGFPSIIVAIFAFYQIPDGPASAKFLSSRARRVATLRLRSDRSETDVASDGFRWKEVAKSLADPKSYLTALMFFSSNVSFASLPPFLPTIIEEMNFSPLASQALSAPPYLVSFLLVLLVAYLSDRARSRAPYIILAALVGASGYAVLAVAGALRLSSWLRYAAVFPSAAGFFVAITLIITWTLNNQPSDEGKGTGLAMLNILGQIGPLVGTRLYPDSDKPYYVRGMATCAVFMALVAVLALTLRVVLVRANEASTDEAQYALIERAPWEDDRDEVDAGPEPAEMLRDTHAREGMRRDRFVYIL